MSKELIGPVEASRSHYHAIFTVQPVREAEMQNITEKKSFLEGLVFYAEIIGDYTSFVEDK